MENLALRLESKHWEESDNGSHAAVEATPPVSPTRGEKNPLREPLHIYLDEIRRYKLLSREVEVELAQRVKEHQDGDAVNSLVTSNLRLVVKIAMDLHRYWNKNMADLIQEGNLGLLQAARRFDPARGVKFSYYASFWIKAYMLKFIMDNWRLVKIGTTQSQRRLFFNLAKEKAKLRAGGFVPDAGVMAERLNVAEEEVTEMTQRLKSGEISLDMPVGESKTENYSAFLRDWDAGADQLLSGEQRRLVFVRKLNKFRERLTERESDILENRIMADTPLVLHKLGKKYNISKERVRQIQKGLVKSIREWSKKEIPNFEEDYSDLLN
jgi:RNA polymerase sigma-32 factor